MKKVLLLAIVYLCLVSCSSDNEDQDPSLVGEWKLIEIYSDPGDGSGGYNPVVSIKTIEFKSNGKYVSNGTLCHLSLESNNASYGTYSSEDKTISPTNCDPMTKLTFEIKNSNLIINHFCIEGCGEKYRKLD